jgi:hypothetical protein
MAKSRDLKRSIVSRIKSGKFSKEDFIGQFKYNYNNELRDYILSKVSKKYTEYGYSNPLPKEIESIASIDVILSDTSDVFDEVKWYFETLFKYYKEVNNYLHINENIQISVLNNDIDLCYDLLDELENKVCCSYYGLQTEFYINEANGKTEINKEIIKEISLDDKNTKLLIHLNFTRLRVDKTISSWQYETTLEVHKKQYNKENKGLVEYLDFKLNPTRYDEGDLTELTLIIFNDSNFSVIDRYISLKKLLPIILYNNVISKEKERKLYELIEKSTKIFNDPYWNKLLITSEEHNRYNYESDDSKKYLAIEELFFNGDYNNVIIECNIIFEKQPHFSDLYLFFTKSIIYTKMRLNDYIEKESELYKILILIYNILLKKDNYSNNRENFLEKYHLFSHFNFSIPLLEFLFNEYRLDIPESIKKTSYLESKALRYNNYRVFNNLESFKEIKFSGNNSIFDFLIKSDDLKHYEELNYFKFKLVIDLLIHKNEFTKAINSLFNYLEKEHIIINQNKFVETWINKNLVRCYFLNEDYSKATDKVIEIFFKERIAYDHYFDVKFIKKIIDLEDYNIYKNISIPIFFEIYYQSQTYIYDRIADFLIANDIEKPSDVIEISENFTLQSLIHFLERVCTKDNIQDSPYLNSINALESERIKILNYLKVLNLENLETYNGEILQITKEASLRKGLLQIHESRIYIDKKNVIKYLSTEVPEMYDRYLGLNDIEYSIISSLKMNEKIKKDILVDTFYFIEPIPEKELINYSKNKNPKNDNNAVIVPLFRYTYFIDIFNTIKLAFIFNEDYGFRSFLSMRIRHGTFSNVLRSVFDKHDLISSMKPNKDEYKEIDIWNEKLKVELKTKRLVQELLKDFSRSIDASIEHALSWINIKKDSDDNYMHMLDFNYSDDEMTRLYRNRLGKIMDYELFLDETFNILYERLDNCLHLLRRKISNELATTFLNKLEELQVNINKIVAKGDKIISIEQEIISCKTDIQSIITQVTKWFKISENQYIDEFPLEMIFQNSLDYINSIHTDSIENSNVTMDIQCDLKFKGKYFEYFGDMLINIFDNIVTKNRDIEKQMRIDIKVVQNSNNLEIVIKNSLSQTVNKKELKISVDNILFRVKEYKINKLNSSFEEGSGFLKICKCISVDLERKDFDVAPRIIKDSFEVSISFELNQLIV